MVNAAISLTGVLETMKMKIIKNVVRKVALMTVAGAICWSATVASANTITELGTVTPGTPANAGQDYTFLTGLIANYNANPIANPATRTWNVPGAPGNGNWVYTLVPGTSIPSTLPTVASSSSYVAGSMVGVSGTTLTIDLSTLNLTADYLTVKWGQDFEAYYIRGLTQVTVNNDVNRNGISGYSFWNGTSVPDGGLTVILLGSALSGLALIRRKLG
jgi:hypothetical protein